MIGAIFTIGHSTHSLDAFIRLLQLYSVDHVEDIRTIPRSRHNPQYNRDTLPAYLLRHGVSYKHNVGLGGLRRARPDSTNTAWRNNSFRGFADYMQTTEFARSIDEVLTTSAVTHAALMCAESVPWRCHRSLIADALLVNAATVMHIMPDGSSHPHVLTSFAVVVDGKVTYPAESAGLK
jgi:uncharacterized protein (DUF488 family)